MGINDVAAQGRPVASNGLPNRSEQPKEANIHV
jgi:hypothetical protein